MTVKDHKTETLDENHFWNPRLNGTVIKKIIKQPGVYAVVRQTRKMKIF